MHDYHSDRAIVLINRSLDGTLSEDDRLELERTAASQPAIASLLREYQALDHLLASVPHEDPSPGLKAAIMAALPPVRRKSLASVASMWTSEMAALLQPRPRYVLAWAASLVVVVSVAVLLTLGGPDVDPSQAVGTMTDSGSVSGSSSDLSVALASYSAILDGSEAELTLHLGAADDLELEVLFDSQTLHLSSVERVKDGTSSGFQLHEDQGVLRLPVETGGSFRILFHVTGVPDPVQVTVLRNELPVVTESVRWSPNR